MPVPLYVSFYTTNGYEAEAMELGKTLDEFGLPAEIVALPPFANWIEACGHKPCFIQRMREKHPGRPLVWLDADARVRQYPRMFLDMASNVDFAAHWKDGTELLSGTLYFGPTKAADSLLVDWWKGCHTSPAQWDQWVLQDLVDKRDGLVIEKLPANYTQIFDLMASAGQPVIEHMQASRRLRR